VLVDEQSVTLK